MTTLLEFPTAPPLPPEPDHVSLTYQGGEYWFTPAELRAHCRYTKEQLVAILAMRSSGIAEEIIEQAFPPKIVAISPTTEIVGVIPGIPVVAAAPIESSPRPEAAAPPVTQHRSRCEHNRQQEPDPAGNIRCMKCDKIIIRGAGFVDNTNHSWNGMSRQGAAAFDPRVRQLIGADGKAHFEPAFRGELA